MGTHFRSLSLTILAAGLTLTTAAHAARSAAPARDPGREGIADVKWKQIPKVLLPRNTVTLAKLKKFERLDMAKLNARRVALRQPTIKAVLLDVDETIAAHHGPISHANKQMIRGLMRSGVAVGVYSNASDDVNSIRKADLDGLRSEGVYVAGGTIDAKPSRAGFDRAVTEFTAHAQAQGLTIGRAGIVMFGDNYMTDGGAIPAGMGFVKVKPVKGDERQFRKLNMESVKRTAQRLMRGYATGVAAIHDRVVPNRPRPIKADQ